MAPSIGQLNPCICMQSGAEEAAAWYAAIFPNSSIDTVVRYVDGAQDLHGREPGTAMVVTLKLNGQPFTILNGPPQQPPSMTLSLQIELETQDEVDYFWDKLGEGGDPEKRYCGWILDKWGVWWQVVPKAVPNTMANGTNEE